MTPSAAPDDWSDVSSPTAPPDTGTYFPSNAPISVKTTPQDSAPDDWSDVASPTPPEEQASNNGMLHLARQIPTGFNEGVADVLGAPVDAATWAMNKIPGVKIANPVGSSDSIKSAMGFIGADPRDLPANTTTEKVLRGAGSGAAAMIAPEAAVGTLARAGALAPEAAATVGRFVGSSATPADAATAAAVGAVGGAAGEGAAAAVPDQYKPLARTTAALVGGGGTALLAETPRAVAQGVRGARDFLKPATPEGREELAGGILASRADNLGDVKEALANPSPELVPGSKPTTFQQTGDMGLGALEREQATRNSADFQQRRADQNTARVQAIQAIQPTGAPTDVANAVRGSLRDIDAMTAGAVERSTQGAQDAAQNLGGNGAPEQYGAALRGPAQDAENAARTREKALWDAIDPDGSLTVSARPVQRAVGSVYGNLTHAAASGLSADEKRLLGVVGKYEPVMPFKELGNLRSEVSGAMRQELKNSGRTPAYGRLSQLRGAVENSLQDAVEHQATQEAGAVARGQMSPDETIAAAVQRQVDAWKAERQSQAGGALAQSASVASSPRTAVVRPGPGSQSKGGRESRNAAGDQGLQGNVQEPPTFDQAARERLTAANTATRERVGTFNQGPVGQILRSAGERGQYRLPDSAVGFSIFKPGPGGFESVQAYRRATGDHAAFATLQDHVASRIKQVAGRPDGTLDPTKTANFLRQHSEAMRAFPELATRFQDAASATHAIEDVAAIRKDALDNYQTGTLGKLLGANDSADVVKTIGNVFSQTNPIQAMRRIVAEVRHDPAAVQGLRKAVIDHLYDRFVSNAEAGTSGTGAMRSDSFQTFVRQNRGALRQVLSEAEVNSLSSIAADLQRSSRSLNAIRIPGQSNTAQDIVGELAKKTEGHGSLLSQILLAGGGGYAAHGATGALAGVVGVLGKNVISRMREAGLAQVDQLVKEAMLHPELAKRLLEKAPAKSTPQASAGLASMLRRLSMFAPAQGLLATDQRRLQ